MGPGHVILLHGLCVDDFGGIRPRTLLEIAKQTCTLDFKMWVMDDRPADVLCLIVHEDLFLCTHATVKRSSM